MIHGEDLRLGIRSLLRRPTESVLLAVAVALAVAASVAGITRAGTSATISKRLLTSIRFRELAVTTMAASATMDAPARTLLDEAHTQLASYFNSAYGDGVLHITDPRTEARAAVDRYRRVARVILFLALAALLIAALNMSNIFASRALRRRRSAGLLKAMGAPGRRVFIVVLVEALVVGATGSAVDVGLAAVLVGLKKREFGVGGPAPSLIVAGVGASWAIVAACSVLPAMAAARAPSADAIRHE